MEFGVRGNAISSLRTPNFPQIWYKRLEEGPGCEGCHEGEWGRMIYFKLNDYVTTTREYPYHHVFGHIPKGTQFTIAKYSQADETSDADFVMVLKDRRMGWLEAKNLSIVQ